MYRSTVAVQQLSVVLISFHHRPVALVLLIVRRTWRRLESRSRQEKNANYGDEDAYDIHKDRVNTVGERSHDDEDKD